MAVGSPAHAQTSVVPSSYTATAGEGLAQGGNFNYFDNTGMQLTDGVTGVNDWTANLGNGSAYEWVGEGSLTRAARAPSVIADASSVGQTPLSYKTSPSQSVKRTSSARAA